jgi:hypothetical protein
MTKAAEEGPRSLEEQLARIAGDDLLVDLEPSYRQGARPGAQSLLSRGVEITVRTIPLLDDPKEMAAVAAALHLRTIDLIEFWEPLLPACKSGQSTAPLKDLRTASQRARALQEVVQGRKESPSRDAVLKKAVAAAERVEAWLPSGKGSSVAPTRYSRGAFDEEGEEDGVARPRTAPPPKVKVERPESPLRRALGWAITLLAIAGMSYGALQVVKQHRPKPRDTAFFNALVADVEDKRLEADAVVFTMSARWLVKPRREREADIDTLRGRLSLERVHVVRFVDKKGGVLASVDESGVVDWLREELTATEALSVGAVQRDPIGETAAPAPTPPPGPEGTLDQPMTAEELRRASSP